MNKLYISVFLLMFSSLTFAFDIDDAKYNDDVCKYTGSSSHDVGCSKKRFEAVEIALNDEYKKLLSRLNEDIERNPQAWSNVKNNYIIAQRAWVDFREKECNAVAEWFTGGTLKWAYYYDCMKSMAGIRINDFYNFKQNK